MRALLLYTTSLLVFWVEFVCLNTGKRQHYLRFSLAALWAWQTGICKIWSTSVLYRVARCGCCVKSVLSNGGCGFELWSSMLQLFIWLLWFLTIIGTLLTSSHGKMEIILMKTSERSQINPLQKYLISVLQQQLSSGLTNSGVETQSVNTWGMDFTGIQGFVVPSCD